MTTNKHLIKPAPFGGLPDSTRHWPAEWTNNDRADRAHKALKDYYEKNWKLCREHREQAVSDLLCDLRHYCDKFNVEFHKADKRGHGNYTEEVGEERNAQ